MQQNSGNLSKFYQGYLGAAVLTSSIPTQSQIDMISGFLAHEYSMTSVLPGAHPYKTAAPTVFGDYESAVYTVNSNDNLSVIAKDVTGTIKFKVTMPDGDTMYLIKYGQEVEFTDEDFTELLWLRQGDQIQIEQIGGTTPAVVTISGGVSLADGSGVSSGGATVLTGSLIG